LRDGLISFPLCPLVRAAAHNREFAFIDEHRGRFGAEPKLPGLGRVVELLQQRWIGDPTEGEGAAEEPNATQRRRSRRS
jgi:hypothetical protein